VAQKNAFDVWITAANTVYKAVPYNIVTDWVTQGRLLADDKLKLSGTEQWVRLGDTAAFATFLPRAEPDAVGDQAEALEAVENEMFEHSHAGEGYGAEEDVDMIPLIDISLVLLIFFMMTTTVAAISRIMVPDMSNATKIDASPETLVLYLDKEGKDTVVYGVGEGTTSPGGADANLSEAGLFERLDIKLASLTRPAKVRIAAHKDLAYEVVERVMKELDRRRNQGVAISEYTVEVGERLGQ
jgi:biopolymer transport protein ExbD